MSLRFLKKLFGKEQPLPEKARKKLRELEKILNIQCKSPEGVKRETLDKYKETLEKYKGYEDINIAKQIAREYERFVKR